MKKTTLLAATFAFAALVSCKKDVPPPPPPAAPAPMDAPAPPPTPEVPPTPENPDGTSVEVGKGGLNVDTKNDGKSTTVKVTDKNAKVEVK